ncbi:MAG: C4-dicarboxylate ABC transporter permease, partial [Firmicutes bacterium]|nr:C4-dicarboxylate ABC transporter permease [Bacillota bacterium]
MSELEKKKKFSLPSTPVLLFLIIVVVMIMTYVIPAGTYDRVLDEASGRTVVDPNSFQYVEQS